VLARPAARVTVVELLLLDELFFNDERLTPPFFEFLDDLLLFAGGEQVCARAIQGDAPLGYDVDLRNGAAIEKLQMRVNALKLARLQFAVTAAQQLRMPPELVVQAIQLPLCLVVRALALRDDQLPAVFDAFAMIEDRLQPKFEFLHVTLINLASVCS
jgi:hypothetical protein